MKAERERQEQERLAAAKAQAERERHEQERLAAAKAQAERKRQEQDRLVALKAERERQEQERLAGAKAKDEQERQEQDRLAALKAERERQEQERLAAAKAQDERERQDQDRLAALKAEQERHEQDNKKAEQEAAERRHAWARHYGQLEKEAADRTYQAMLAEDEKYARERAEKRLLMEEEKAKYREEQEAKRAAVSGLMATLNVSREEADNLHRSQQEFSTMTSEDAEKKRFEDENERSQAEITNLQNQMAYFEEKIRIAKEKQAQLENRKRSLSTLTSSSPTPTVPESLAQPGGADRTMCLHFIHVFAPFSYTLDRTLQAEALPLPGPEAFFMHDACASTINMHPFRIKLVSCKLEPIYPCTSRQYTVWIHMKFMCINFSPCIYLLISTNFN